MLHFNPGCALCLYKPETVHTLVTFLKTQFPDIALHNICCHYDPKVPAGARIVNICAGCDRRFRTLYEGVSTVSLWEILHETDSFPFPDYGGLTLSIQDPCPVRERPEVHRAVRSLLNRMNIQVVEPEHSGTRSVCCGDSFYPHLPAENIREKMRQRANAMPCDAVCVYCISCIKSMHTGGKRPRYLLDLLLGEPTEPQVTDTAEWHRTLEEYRASHTQ